MNSVDVARSAAQAAYDKKASDIRIIDISEISDMCDCLVIATADNKIQADTIVKEVEDRVYEQCSQKPLSCEGRASGSWVLLDFGNIVVHVFQPDTREFYRLEKLWENGTEVELDLI